MSLQTLQITSIVVLLLKLGILVFGSDLWKCLLVPVFQKVTTVCHTESVMHYMYISSPSNRKSSRGRTPRCSFPYWGKVGVCRCLLGGQSFLMIIPALCKGCVGVCQQTCEASRSMVTRSAAYLKSFETKSRASSDTRC